MDKLYVVVDGRLPPGDQLAQAMHAALDLALGGGSHKRVADLLAWNVTSNTLVVLEAPDEASLRQLAAEADRCDLDHALFTEPDLGGQATAVALAPGELAKRLCRGYRLALRRHAA